MSKDLLKVNEIYEEEMKNNEDVFDFLLEAERPGDKEDKVVKTKAPSSEDFAFFYGKSEQQIENELKEMDPGKFENLTKKLNNINTKSKGYKIISKYVQREAKERGFAFGPGDKTHQFNPNNNEPKGNVINRAKKHVPNKKSIIGEKKSFNKEFINEVDDSIPEADVIEEVLFDIQKELNNASDSIKDAISFFESEKELISQKYPKFNKEVLNSLINKLDELNTYLSVEDDI